MLEIVSLLIIISSAVAFAVGNCGDCAHFDSIEEKHDETCNFKYPLWKVMIVISSKTTYVSTIRQLRNTANERNKRQTDLAVDRIRFYDEICADILPNHLSNDLILSLHDDATYWKDFPCLKNKENFLTSIIRNA